MPKKYRNFWGNSSDSFRIDFNEVTWYGKNIKEIPRETPKPIPVGTSERTYEGRPEGLPAGSS